MLPQDVVNQDAELEGRRDSASLSLGQLRWHWTLDESNPDRVSVTEYARCVARSRQAIKVYVSAYEDHLQSTDCKRSWEDCLARARYSVKRADAAEIIAKTKGISIRDAVDKHKTEVQTLEELAEARCAAAAQRGEDLTFREAAEDAYHFKTMADRSHSRALNTRPTVLKSVEALSKLTAARKKIVSAIPLVGPDDAETLRDVSDDIVRVISDLRATLELPPVDWDAELVKAGLSR